MSNVNIVRLPAGFAKHFEHGLWRKTMATIVSLLYNPALFRAVRRKVVVMNLVLLLMAFCVGIAISLQAAVNSQLSMSLGANSLVAALVSFSVGTVVLALIVAARGGLAQVVPALAAQAPWKLCGGFLGAAFVFGSVFLAPRIGLLNMVVLVVAGQLLMSIAIDNFGLVQMAVRKVSVVRLAGALVMVLGVALTLFGDRIAANLGR
jgi:transporter family-2 protein